MGGARDGPPGLPPKCTDGRDGLLRVLTLPAWVLLLVPLSACNEGRELGRNEPSGSATSSKPAPPPSATTAPVVPMAMEFARPMKRAAVVDYLAAEASGRNCQVHRACKAFVPLKPCEAGIEPIEASAFGAFVPRALGERVSVRGPLGLSLSRSAFVACNQQFRCCSPTTIEAFLGRVPDGVRLEGLTCYGDESRLCCPVPAFGQVVVATGRVLNETSGSVLAHGGRFMLADPILCSEAVR
jgi:hypothetical protein